MSNSVKIPVPRERDQTLDAVQAPSEDGDDWQLADVEGGGKWFLPGAAAALGGS